LQQRSAQVEPVADVAAIAMAYQDGKVGAGRICAGRKQPAVQFDPIGGFKLNIFKRAAQAGRGRLQFAGRMVNLAMFEPAQHDNHHNAAEEKPDPTRPRAPAFPQIHA
jgi:hypothetical protein